MIVPALHSTPRGTKGSITGFLYGRLPLPALQPYADPVPQPIPQPLLLGKAGKFKLNGPLYPSAGPTYYQITGTTRDAAFAPLIGVTVYLFRTADNVLMETETSDASGSFILGNVGGGEAYYIVGYKAGTPDLSGITANTLVGGNSVDITMRNPLGAVQGLVRNLVQRIIPAQY